jgi:hypothetical protein
MFSQMGLDGRNTLEVRGPDEMLDEMESKGFLFDTEDEKLKHIGERFFGLQNIYVDNRDGRHLIVSYEFRNVPVYEYLEALLCKYPKCWMKNTYSTDAGDCGLWVARMRLGKPDIQTCSWIELCDEEVMMGFDFSRQY